MPGDLEKLPALFPYRLWDLEKFRASPSALALRLGTIPSLNLGIRSGTQKSEALRVDVYRNLPIYKVNALELGKILNSPHILQALGLGKIPSLTLCMGSGTWQSEAPNEALRLKKFRALRPIHPYRLQLFIQPHRHGKIPSFLPMQVLKLERIPREVQRQDLKDWNMILNLDGELQFRQVRIQSFFRETHRSL